MVWLDYSNSMHCKASGSIQQELVACPYQTHGSLCNNSRQALFITATIYINTMDKSLPSISFASNHASLVLELRIEYSKGYVARIYWPVDQWGLHRAPGSLCSFS